MKLSRGGMNLPLAHSQGLGRPPGLFYAILPSGPLRIDCDSALRSGIGLFAASLACSLVTLDVRHLALGAALLVARACRAGCSLRILLVARFSTWLGSAVDFVLTEV